MTVSQRSLAYCGATSLDRDDRPIGEVLWQTWGK